MKYIDVERLRARIEKDLTFDNSIDTAYYKGRRDAERSILTLIDSLPDEPVSNDLEEAAETFCDTLEGKEAWSYGPSHYDWDDVNNAFIAGAEWMAKHKEQKPAEWSEEDKDKVVQYLHDRDGGMLWSKATDITRDILDMLRPVSKESLQPHWKPSENQMSMLLAVVNDPNNAGSASCHLSLKSLYNDLKKL